MVVDLALHGLGAAIGLGGQVADLLVERDRGGDGAAVALNLLALGGDGLGRRALLDHRVVLFGGLLPGLPGLVGLLELLACLLGQLGHRGGVQPPIPVIVGEQHVAEARGP